MMYATHSTCTHTPPHLPTPPRWLDLKESTIQVTFGRKLISVFNVTMSHTLPYNSELKGPLSSPDTAVGCTPGPSLQQENLPRLLLQIQRTLITTDSQKADWEGNSMLTQVTTC